MIGAQSDDLQAFALEADDMKELAGALAAADLPTDDIEEEGRLFWRFVNDTTVGFGGIEGTGPDRLLRSLVVVDGRGRGRGSAMLALLEDAARGAGAERLHLLTTSAGPFFRARGYSPASRSQAPAEIAGSREFRSLCPASAEYLVKALADPLT